jgi:very-short-patch-repair endonuclease
MEQREFARQLRHQMTESETRLWRYLRARRLCGEKFRRQQPIGPYVVDFVHFGARLIVEADGGQHNGAPRDERRDAWLRAQGFKVMRFWNNEIMSNLEGVLAAVMAELAELPLSPSPSPARGEGSVTPFVSALDQAGDVVGCFSGGPTDLSSNPDHLASFGRT